MRTRRGRALGKLRLAVPSSMASEGGPCGNCGRVAHAQHGSPGAHRPGSEDGSRADPPSAGPGGRPRAARGGGQVLRTARRRDQAKRPRPTGPGRQGATSKRAAAGARGARAAMAMRKPSPSAPSRAPAGTRTASSCTAAVGCAHQPSLASGRPTLRPGAPCRAAAPPQRTSRRDGPRRAQAELSREPRTGGEVARACRSGPVAAWRARWRWSAARHTAPQALRTSCDESHALPAGRPLELTWIHMCAACVSAVYMQGMLCRVFGTGDAAAPPNATGRPGQRGWPPVRLQRRRCRATRARPCAP